MNDGWLDDLDAWKTAAPEEDGEEGEACPVCGDMTFGGDGPCSDECERVLSRRERGE